MARDAADREDILAEVVALSPRAEFDLGDGSPSVVAGRRDDGRWSIFFGGDPVYHFDAQSRLRRAFVDGLLYRSHGTTLARLARLEQAEQTVLQRHDLTDDELNEFLSTMRQTLMSVCDAVSQVRIRVLRVVPEGSNYLTELAAVIDQALKSSHPLSPAIVKR